MSNNFVTRGHAEFIARVLLTNAPKYNESGFDTWCNIVDSFAEELRTSSADISTEDFLKQCGYK